MENIYFCIMNLQQCEQEIQDRHYLINAVLTHASGTYRIKIHSLLPLEVHGYYQIQCNYYRETAKDQYEGLILTDRLSDVLSTYVYY